MLQLTPLLKLDQARFKEIDVITQTLDLSRAFEDLDELARYCRFRDCRHQGEPGCAVRRAIDEGALSTERLENHRKMEAELRFLKAKGDPRARREDKERIKRLCKAQKRGYRER